MTTPATIEGYPQVSTMGIGWQIANGPAWRYSPPATDHWVSFGSTATLGTGIAVTTATVLAKGTWVVATTAPAAQIVVSDGTTHAPVAGEAYPLTVV